MSYVIGTDDLHRDKITLLTPHVHVREDDAQGICEAAGPGWRVYQLVRTHTLAEVEREKQRRLTILDEVLKDFEKTHGPVDPQTRARAEAAWDGPRPLVSASFTCPCGAHVTLAEPLPSEYRCGFCTRIYRKES